MPVAPTVRSTQTKPPTPPPTNSDSEGEEPEEKEEVEDAEPAEDGEPAEGEGADAIAPKTTNPLTPPDLADIDKLIQTQINADMWKSLISPLPCLETTTTCVSQLQSLAVSNSPIIKKIEESVTAIETKIDEATSTNKQSINLAVFEPALQYLLTARQGAVQPTGQTGQATQTQSGGGILSNLFGLLTRPVGFINELASVIGIPLLRRFTGGNQEQKAASIAIADLRIKTEELRRSKEEIAVKTRDAVQFAVLEFDVRSREFQIQQAISRREIQRFQLYKVGYRFGQSSTEAYLGQQSSLDKQKASVLREWAQMRSQLEKIKLLVLSNLSEE